MLTFDTIRWGLRRWLRARDWKSWAFDAAVVLAVVAAAYFQNGG